MSAVLFFGTSNVTFAKESDVLSDVQSDDTDTENTGSERTDVLQDAGKKKAKRTILMYDCGTDLETLGGLASYNLRQILSSTFSADEEINFIVMTGGADKWHLESEYLYDPETGESPGAIDTVYNQIWEAKGKDAPDPEEVGRLVLVDRDGVLGDGEDAKRNKISEDDMIIDENGCASFDYSSADNYEWMSDPDVLRAFIDYGAANYPADKYDLIIWDHGSGSSGGAVYDMHDCSEGSEGISLDEMIDVFRDNAVTREGGKFDIVNFDACLMNSVEIDIALSDYMDYFIASPAEVPGYGQEYTGWLNLLGSDTDIDTYSLGKRIVDDFVAFYDKENDDGYLREGTLALIDMNRLMTEKKEGMDFVEAMSIFSDIMETEAIWEHQYYDELRSLRSSIRYGDKEYYDLGNLMSFLSYVYDEADYEDLLPDGGIDDTSVYTYIANVINGFLHDPGIVYAKGTRGVHTDEDFYRTDDGSIELGTMETSGIYISSVPVDRTLEVTAYLTDMEKVIANMDPGDPKTEFLKSYLQTVTEYALIVLTGKTVTYMVSEGADKSEIDYAAVKDRWENDPEAGSSPWESIVKPVVDMLEGGEEAAKDWLDPIIRHMAQEAVSKANISARADDQETGAGIVTFTDVKKQVIESVNVDIVAELPAVKSFTEDPDNAEYLVDHGYMQTDLVIGSIKGYEILDTDSETQGYEAAIDWLFDTVSSWRIYPVQTRWYALEDASGSLHVTAPEIDDDEIDIPCAYPSKEAVLNDDGIEEMKTVWHRVYLVFENDEIEDWELTNVFYVNEDGSGYRQIPASEYTGEQELWPVINAFSYSMSDCYIPISNTSFILSEQMINDIKLRYTDIDDISDIADTDGDGKDYSARAVVKNIYEKEIDISDIVNAVIYPVSISDAVVSGIEDASYTGEPVTPIPVVTLGDKILTPGVDYIVSYKDNTEPGTAIVVIEGTGRYKDSITREFQIIRENETSCAETDPEVTEPAETDNAETSTNENEPSETVNSHTSPAVTDPEETEPAESGNIETKPAETKAQSVDGPKSSHSADGGGDHINVERPVQKASSPITGDDSNIPVLITLVLAAAGILVTTVILRRKKD